MKESGVVLWETFGFQDTTPFSVWALPAGIVADFILSLRISYCLLRTVRYNTGIQTERMDQLWEKS